VHEVLAQEMEKEVKKRKASKAPPHCSLCKKPMKGHKMVSECPRNKEEQT